VFALDTNILIYYFRGVKTVNARVLLIGVRKIAIPAPVLFELETGILKSTHPQKRRGQLDALLAATTVLPFGQAAAVRAAEIRVLLDRAGTPIGPIDILIAAIALEHGITLVTHNTAEFRRVPALTLEDWF